MDGTDYFADIPAAPAPAATAPQQGDLFADIPAPDYFSDIQAAAPAETAPVNGSDYNSPSLAPPIR